MISYEGPSEIAAALEEFAEVQREHAQLLAGNRLKSLPSWYDRRQQVFMRLKRCFEGVDLGPGSGEREVAGQILEKIKEILLGEQSLKTLAGQQRTVIEEKLRTMRKGKKVLQGYSLSPGAGPKPKYLSSRT